MWSNYWTELLIRFAYKRAVKSSRLMRNHRLLQRLSRRVVRHLLAAPRSALSCSSLHFGLPLTMAPGLLRVTLKRWWTLSPASQINLVTVEERSGSLLGEQRSSNISSLISLWTSTPFFPNWILQERCPWAADLSYPKIGGDELHEGRVGNI